jgi:hypothetical protein
MEHSKSHKLVEVCGEMLCPKCFEESMVGEVIHRKPVPVDFEWVHRKFVKKGK